MSYPYQVDWTDAERRAGREDAKLALERKRKRDREEEELRRRCDRHDYFLTGLVMASAHSGTSLDNDAPFAGGGGGDSGGGGSSGSWD